MEATEADFKHLPLVEEECDGYNNCVEESEFGRKSEVNSAEIHLFYFVKPPPSENLSVKIRMHETEQLIKERNRERSPIAEQLQEKKAERGRVVSEVQYRSRWNGFDYRISWISREIELLEHDLNELRCSKNPSRGRGPRSCSLENQQERSSYIRSLNHRMRHGSHRLMKEKKLLREIKQIESTDMLDADLALQRNISRFKYLQEKLHEEKREQMRFTIEINHLNQKLEAIQTKISALERKLSDVDRQKAKPYICILQLKSQSDMANSCYNQSASMLSNARELARRKDVGALKELSKAQVETFMSLWNSSKALRNDYEERLLPFA